MLAAGKKPTNTVMAHGSHEEPEVPPQWRDRLGICLSALCLAHCLLTPFVIGLLPVGTALGFWHQGIHKIFLLLVPAVAFLAFIPGWRVHRDARVLYWGGMGVVFLAIGVLLVHGEAGQVHSTFELVLEYLPTMLGGACLIRAHLLNRHLCACCAHHHH